MGTAKALVNVTTEVASAWVMNQRQWEPRQIAIAERGRRRREGKEAASGDYFPKRKCMSNKVGDFFVLFCC